MSRITAIASSTRHPQRASIKVDGKTVATLNYALIEELGLAPQQPWNDTLAQRVAEAAAFDKAWRAAMRRLERRAMSQRQLIDKLKTLDFTPPVIDRVVCKLLDLNILDDRAYGEALIRQIQRAKPAGPRLLRTKLMQKGLAPSLIDELLRDNTPNAEQSVDEARQLARRKLPSLLRYDPATRKRRLWGLLARRGFDSDIISEALQTLPELQEEV